MNESILPLICDPETHENLELRGEALVNPRSSKRYPLRQGIPDFLDAASGQNRKYQVLYDRIAFLYDPTLALYSWIKPNNFRQSYLGELEIPAGARVLEVSVGTGGNIFHIRSDVQFFGLDLSWGMLRRCVKNLRRWHRSAELFHGEAEHLPFRDSVFDVVLHVGGINFFNDRARSIQEMIRVAKPGTKIVIVDETEKVVKSSYEKTPLVGKYFRKRTNPVTNPSDLVPRTMLDLRSKELLDGRIYCVSFRTPGQWSATQA